MENPQNLVTPEPTQVQEKSPLFQVTPLSKYLAMILFIALPFLGFWIGTVFQSTQETVIPAPMITEKESNFQKPTDQAVYLSPDGVYSIALVEGVSAAPLVSYDFKDRNNEERTEIYSEGTLELKGLFSDNYVPVTMNRVDYNDISEINPIISDLSCCASIQYWYSSKKNEWAAATSSFNAETNKKVTVDQSLSRNGMCNLDTRFKTVVLGNNTYYIVNRYFHEGGTTFDYYLLTDQGYALRINMDDDLKADYSKYPADVSHPTAEEIARAEKILAGITIPNGKVITATCK